jgi:hypothetical protein
MFGNLLLPVSLLATSVTALEINTLKERRALELSGRNKYVFPALATSAERRVMEEN